MRPRLLALVAVVIPLWACQPEANPAGLAGNLTASRRDVSAQQGLASPGWQGTTIALVAQNNVASCAAGRVYALVGVAQYLAVQRAEGDNDREGEDERGGRSRRAADRGAVAGASVVVLRSLFPAQAQALEDLVTAQRGAGSERAQRAFARGEAIGRAVGATIVTRGQTDGWATPFTGTIPVGAGFWISNTTNPATVACGSLPGTRPWFLTSASQFRAAPPPAFGSPAFKADSAEIRAIFDTRTTLQVQIATFWGLGTGTATTTGFWMQRATDGVTQHHLSERRATHLYALLSATMADAIIGCWDAKQTYWVIRPWQADTGIRVVAAVGKPNHPSYPSGHSCASASAAEVLGRFFPEQRAELDAMVTEAGLSRMYAGIHYRFDIEAGRVLGRRVAHFAIAADRSGESVLGGEHGEERDGRR